MRKLHPELVAEFYNKIKHTHPDMTLEQCNDIVSAPFRQLKEGITNGNFPTVRLKFFGTFVVYPKRVEAILKNYTKMFKECRMTPVNYFKKKGQLENFLKTKKNEPTDKLD